MRGILHALVTEFIRSGAPVASAALKQRGIDLSPATIRHVLAELEEQGLLEQPYTSAGRVPTELGLRVFVDALIEPEELSQRQRARILTQLQALPEGRDDVMRAAGRLLVSLTGAAAILLPPRPDQDVLAQLRFVPIGEGRLLAVLVTRSGNVENRVVRLDEPLETDELERLHNLLASWMDGKTLADLRETAAHALSSEQGRYRSLYSRLIRLLNEALSEPERPSVVIEGEQQLYDCPEFSDVQQLRSVLRALADRERLLEVLDRTLAAERVHVLIGSEVSLGDIHSLSLIAAACGNGSQPGTLGILGPTRMDYARLIPLVAFTANAVRSVLDRPCS